MAKVDALPPNLFEANQEKSLNAFRLELPVIEFVGAGFEPHHWGGKILWGEYFRYLTKSGLLTDKTGKLFEENNPITGIKFLHPDGELLLAVGLEDGEMTIFTERTRPDSPTFCAWPGAYLLEKYLRGKNTSVARLTELGKWFVEISTLDGQRKEFNAGVFLWRGQKQELRIAAAGARMDELLFTSFWPKPDFALDFEIRID